MSPAHWLIVVLVFALFFGAKRLPDAARSLGRSMRIFKSEVQVMHAEPDAKAEADGSDDATVRRLPAGERSAQVSEAEPILRDSARARTT